MVEGGGRLRIEPTVATLGALVTGVRLTEVSDEDWERIEAAFLDRSVLIFPGQHLNEQQLAFGRRWGELNESQALSNRRAGPLPDTQTFRPTQQWAMSHLDSALYACTAMGSRLPAAARQPPNPRATRFVPQPSSYRSSMASTSSGFIIPCLRDPPDRDVGDTPPCVPSRVPPIRGSAFVSPWGQFCVSPDTERRHAPDQHVRGRFPPCRTKVLRVGKG